MATRRRGFLLPGFLLTLLACLGVTAIVLHASGTLPEAVPILRTGAAPRRTNGVTVPPSPTRTASPPVTAAPGGTAGPGRTAGPEWTAGPGRTAAPGRTAGPVVPTATPPGTPPATVPPCRAGAATVRAVADAYVDQASPGKSFGTADRVVVASRDRDRNARGLVRFALPAVPEGCTLRGATLTMTTPDPTGRRVLVARAARAWSESVTWATAPAPAGAATGATVSSATVRWSLPASAVSANGFVLWDAAENARGAGATTAFASRASRPATLTVRWG
ncbi:MAG TPA: DNRLRE domain-containing protein [Mycobacteriales bacterium]